MRLDREFNMNVITTVPNVSYNIYDKHGEMKEVHNPAGMPDQTEIDHIEEPYIRASIIAVPFPFIFLDQASLHYSRI